MGEIVSTLAAYNTTAQKLETCGDCAELEHCETLSAITGNDPQALRNLKGES